MAYLDSLSSPCFAPLACAWLSTMDIQLNSAVLDSLSGVSRQPAVPHFRGVFTQPTTNIRLLRFSGITLWVGLDGLASLFVVVSCCLLRAALPACSRSLGFSPHELWVPWLASTFVHDFSTSFQSPRRILSHLARVATRLSRSSRCMIASPDHAISPNAGALDVVGYNPQCLFGPTDAYQICPLPSRKGGS
jgi:hypothetical protein